jgi:hypothetical protein
MSGEAWLEVGPGHMPRTELTNITIQGVHICALIFIIYRWAGISGEARLEVGPGHMPRTELTNITIQGVHIETETACSTKIS